MLVNSFPGARARPGPGEHCGSGTLAVREYLEAQGGWKVWSAEQKDRLGTGRCVRPPVMHCLPLHGVCLPLGRPAPMNLSPGGLYFGGSPPQPRGRPMAHIKPFMLSWVLESRGELSKNRRKASLTSSRVNRMEQPGNSCCLDT